MDVEESVQFDLLGMIKISLKFSCISFSNVTKFYLEPTIQKIINKSRAAREKAYCPYSKFSVGAALLCDDGTIIDGCNVENVSYGLTICAERTAVVKAVSQGQKKFQSIAICAEMKDKFVGPCGACRQVEPYKYHFKHYCEMKDEIFEFYLFRFLLNLALT